MALKKFEGELDQPKLSKFEGELDAPEEKPLYEQALDVASEGIQLPEAQPRNRSWTDTARSMVTGEGRKVEGIQELPIGVHNIRHAKDPEQAAQLMRMYADQPQAKVVPGLSAGMKGIKPVGFDDFNNPLFVSDQPITAMGVHIPAGEKFYSNVPGISVQDFRDVGETIPEMAITAGGGWLSGLFRAFVGGAGNKAVRSTLVDLETGDYRSMPQRVTEAAMEGTMAAGGEGVGRFGGYILTNVIPKSLLKLWTRHTNKVPPTTWVDDQGNLTDAAMTALRDEGIPPEQINNALIQELDRASHTFTGPDHARQLVRLAEARMSGAEPTLADLTDLPDARQGQSMVMRESTPTGASMRHTVEQQSDAARRNLTQMAQADVPAADTYTANLNRQRLNATGRVREVLRTTEADQAGASSALYEAAKELPQELEFNIRTAAESALEGLDDMNSHIAQPTIDNIRTTMMRYGYFGADEVAPDLVTHELTINNAVELTKLLGKAERAAPDNLKFLYRDIINGINDDIASIRLPAQLAGAADYDKVVQFEAARSAWANYKSNWHSSKFIEDLIERPRGSVPKLSDADAWTKLTNMKPEEMRFVSQALMGAGPEGRDALMEFRATTLMNLLEDSMESGSDVITKPTMSADKLATNIAKFKDGTLDELLTPAQRTQLSRLERVVKAQKLRGLTSMKDPTQEASLVREAIRSALGSVWLFRHSGYIGSLVASGKVSLAETSKLQKKILGDTLKRGGAVVNSKKFQKKMFDNMVSQQVEDNFPRILEMLEIPREVAKTTIKEETRSRGTD